MVSNTDTEPNSDTLPAVEVEYQMAKYEKCEVHKLIYVNGTWKAILEFSYIIVLPIQ